MVIIVDPRVLGNCPTCGKPIGRWNYEPAIEELPPVEGWVAFGRGPVDGDVATFDPCGHVLTGAAAYEWLGQRDARAIPFSRSKSTVPCECGYDGEDWRCIEGRVYGPCGHADCGGVCEYLDDCKHECHQGG